MNEFNLTIVAVEKEMASLQKELFREIDKLPLEEVLELKEAHSRLHTQLTKIKAQQRALIKRQERAELKRKKSA